MFVATYPGVARTVQLLMGDRAVAEEVTQEAFIQLLLHWRKVSRFERPDMWVRRVAIRRAQRERSRMWRRGSLEQSLAPLSEAGPPPEPDDEIRAAVDTLPPKQRAVVVLFYFEDRPMDEIATILGCTPSTAWNHLRAARQRLATLMGEEVTDDVR